MECKLWCQMTDLLCTLKPDAERPERRYHAGAWERSVVSSTLIVFIAPRSSLYTSHLAIRRDSGTDALLYHDVMNTADRDVGEG